MKKPQRDDKLLPLCNSCAESAAARRREIADASPISYVTGTIGALLGALIGSAVWIGIGAAGFYASIGGVAIAYAAFFGYRTLGGKSSKVSVLIIAVSVLAAVIFAELFGVGLELARYAKSEGIQVPIPKLAEVVFELVREGDVSEIYMNMGIGILFAGLGAYGILKKIFFGAEQGNVSIRKV